MIFKQKTKLSALALTCMMLCSGNVWSAGPNEQAINNGAQDHTTFLNSHDAIFVRKLWSKIAKDALIKHLEETEDLKFHHTAIQNIQNAKKPYSANPFNILGLIPKTEITSCALEYFQKDKRAELQKILNENQDLLIPDQNKSFEETIKAIETECETDRKTQEANSAARIQKARDNDDAERHHQGMIAANIKPVAWIGVPAMIIGALAIFGGKNLFDYWKEKAMIPPFVDDTNDVGTFSGITSWFTGDASGTYIPNRDKLFFNKTQNSIINAVTKDHLKAMEYNLPSPHYLFYGPAGTGKTTLARQLAYNTDSYYYLIKASAFLDKEGPRQFRQLMRRVRSVGNRPIIVVDEADSLIGYSSELKGRALTIFNDLLTELGDTNNRVCTFIFTTNLPDRIDPRMMDRLEKVQFINPDIPTRTKIIGNKLKYYFHKDLGELDPIEYDQLTPEIIKLAAEATKDWSCRAYSKFVESLRRVLINNDNFICTPKDLFDHIAFFNERNKADEAAKIALRQQYGQKK